MDVSVKITVQNLERKLKLVDQYERARVIRRICLSRRQLRVLLALAQQANPGLGSRLERVQQLARRPQVSLTGAETRLLLTLALQVMRRASAIKEQRNPP